MEKRCDGVHLHTLSDLFQFESSRSQMFFKLGALKNFANLTRKHLWWNLFLIKLEAALLKRDPTQVFSCEIGNIFKNTLIYRTPSVTASVNYNFLFKKGG